MANRYTADGRAQPVIVSCGRYHPPWGFMRGPGRNASLGAPYFIVLASGPWHAPGNTDVSQARRPGVSHGPVRTRSCVGWLCDRALARDCDRARCRSRGGKCVASLRTSAASVDHTRGAPSPLVSPEGPCSLGGERPPAGQTPSGARFAPRLREGPARIAYRDAWLAAGALLDAPALPWCCLRNRTPFPRSSFQPAISKTRAPRDVLLLSIFPLTIYKTPAILL